MLMVKAIQVPQAKLPFEPMPDMSNNVETARDLPFFPRLVKFVTCGYHLLCDFLNKMAMS